MERRGADQSVGAVIREEIARRGPIPFARFMALALYHPTLGYYAGGGASREPLGWAGDYFTSGDVSPLWGWAVARQLREMWELLGRPTRFDVIEAGAGRGILAREVWRFARFSAPEWGEALYYTLVDSASTMDSASVAREGGLRGGTPPERSVAVSTAGRAAGETCLAPTSAVGVSLFQARRAKLANELERIGVPADRVHWVSSLGGVAGGPARSQANETRYNEASAAHRITGVIVSNELIDALPAHVVQVVGNDSPRVAEVHVDLDAQGRLFERLESPSSPQVAEYLDRFGIPWRSYGSGWRAEINLAAEQWMREAAGMLGRGFLLTIDYGVSARRLYTRDRRHGTLAVYSRHQFGDRPLAAPGQQDITAHVNFSALARVGQEQGLAVAGYTTQGAFLRRLGVVEAARMLGQRLYPAADSERQSDRGQAALLRRRMLESAANTLLDPRGLGGFRVLVQQRGAPSAKQEITGLRRG